IGTLSAQLAKILVNKKHIDQEDFELYHYGLFIVLSELFLFSFCILAGLLLKITSQSIVFFAAFLFIRRYAGGLHVKTESQCLALTLTALLISIILIKVTLIYDNPLSAVAIQLICSILLPIISPADTPQKKLSDKERKVFKRITVAILITFAVINALLFYFRISRYAIPVVYAVLLETVLVIFGRIFNGRLAESADEA
ncbi:MAG: accessory gene regulator B family protein, partial [Eubacterium sp.]|nr:accessory gene regulator B family protein [Eubacterium sp.]